jgi:RNA polymerase sigma-70 factor (ECF subfamily)
MITAQPGKEWQQRMAFNLPDLATEDRLLARLTGGDKAVWSVIYERYFPAVYRFIRMRTPDKALAEDIASEVFIKLLDYSQLRRGPRTSLRGWLFKVTRHEMSRHLKQAQRTPLIALDTWEVPDDNADIEVQFIRTVDSEQALRALQKLNPNQQEVLILRFVEDLSLQETADVLGKNANAIKALQFRAVNTLRTLLGEMRTRHE